ncbi:hypothetical protein ACLOJK_004132 [Asimina triloba]
MRGGGRSKTIRGTSIGEAGEIATQQKASTQADSSTSRDEEEMRGLPVSNEEEKLVTSNPALGKMGAVSKKGKRDGNGEERKREIGMAKKSGSAVER